MRASSGAQIQFSMTGAKHKGLVIQERDRHLLRELSLMRVIDREQAKIVAGFHSITRVNRRLLALTRGGLLNRFFIGTAGAEKALYSLSPLGANLVQVPRRSPRIRKDEVVAVSFSLYHQLDINQLYCALKYEPIPFDGAKLARWESFYRPIDSGVSLVPDGYMEVFSPVKVLVAFLELDLGHESLSVWKAKVHKYVRYAVSGDFERSFHQPQFRVLVITNSERRLQAIRRTVAAITDKIFWFATMDSIHRNGFWSPIWLRPTGDHLPLSLL